MSLRLHVDGIEDAILGFDRIDVALRSDGVRQIFQVGAEAIADTAREIVHVYDGAPIKGVTPGELRDGIFARAYVKEGVPYALCGVSGVGYAMHIEYGTEHNAAFPYIRPAVDRWQGTIGEPIVQAVAALLE